MRNIVFRILAGILAILIGWFLIFADHKGLPWSKLISFGMLTIVFAAYSALGSSAAERILTAWLNLGCSATQADDPHEPRRPR